ncbi:MAG: glycosyltransferase family 4 protein [Nitrospirales bacterium]
MKVMWLGHNLAYPPKGGALQRNYNLLREIARKCEVHVLAFDQPVTRPTNVSPQDCLQALSRFCASAEWVSLSSSSFGRTRYGLAITGIMTGEPYDFAWLRAAQMADKLRNMVEKVSPDVVHVDTLGLAQYLPAIGSSRSVLNHHDVESCKIELRARKERNVLLKSYFKMEARKLAAAERRWCPQFDVNAVVSEDEGSVLSQACPGLRVRVVPNGVDTEYFTPRADPGTRTILFCGSMDMHPNQEAMEYFLRQIWPRLVAQVPDVNLQVVGRKPPEWLNEVARTDPRVQVTGFVDDVRPYFQKAAVCICPILSGGGTRLKILDSLAMGVPVVATSFAASGLSLEHGKHLFLTDTEQQFADYIQELLATPALRLKLASAGSKRVDELYSWTVVGQTLMDVYELACHGSIQAIHQA